MIRLKNTLKHNVFLEVVGDEKYRLLFNGLTPTIKKGWCVIDMNTITFLEIEGTTRFTVGENVAKIEPVDVEINEDETKIEYHVTFFTKVVPKYFINEE